MKDNLYDKLNQLINAYFHQDWSDDHDDEESVLADFACTNWRDEVELTISQIDRYLLEHPDGLLDSFVSDFSPMIIIGSNDTEAMAWLEHARTSLSKHLSASSIRSDSQAYQAEDNGRE